MKWRDPTHGEALKVLIEDAGISKAKALRIINAELGAQFHEINFERYFYSPEAKNRKDPPAWVPYVLEMGLRRRGLLRIRRSRQ